ncbi:peptide/nickel transport system substrate-binding protein [Rhodoligotrophos appendicifer]|uniref:ABC transporter substrate-binding protein n=1 Tax=Rhodoligotrophos appendicifer TaxID=987056 RepID=UPI001FEB0AD9|nr:ABC transporter substrate-binding protein [Rhodoligotrophos appendicifer]
MSLDADNKLVPLLAESWSANSDQTRFTFKLAPNAKFSDGTPVEAKDVKWSWERLKNLKGAASFLLETLTSIEAPDNETVIAIMGSPNSEFLNLIAAPYAAIVNSDIAMENGARAGVDAPTADKAEAWFLRNSAGSAPFVLGSYLAGAELRLKKNDKYWRSEPAFSEVVIREVKDPALRAKLLDRGEVDIAMQIELDAAKAIKNPDITVRALPSFSFIYLALSAGAKDNDVPLTKEVREAIGYGINRKAILELMIDGEGQLITAPIPYGFPGGTGYPDPVYDPARAKAMLTSAGHPNGFNLEAIFPDLKAFGVDFPLLFKRIKDDLSLINVKVNLQSVPFSAWRSKIIKDGIPLTAAFYSPDYFGTAQFFEYFGMMEKSPWAIFAHLKDKDDLNVNETELYKEALSSDARATEGIWHELGLHMIDDKIIFPIMSPHLILAYRSDIKGVRHSPCCNLPLSEISR